MNAAAIHRESLLNPGEHLVKMSTEGWIAPANHLPVGCDIIVDWPSGWRVTGADPEEGKPFRCTVDGHYFNGVIQVMWPQKWKRQEHRSTLNLGDDCWYGVYRIIR